MSRNFTLDGKTYGPGRALIIAELSANHRGSLNCALELVDCAAECGADAVKVQTFTADSMTIQSRRPEFLVSGTAWNGKSLHDLYTEGSMPWHWQPLISERCRQRGLHFFSSPFDAAAVEFLEGLDVPAYKIASFELVDTPLIAKAASTGKLLIISTGMGSLAEIDAAVNTAVASGASQVVLLKCTSAYPAPASEMNLRTIPHLAETFGVVAGLSDHTQGIAVPVAAVALGAGVIEKHFILSRSDGGLDSKFSLEPEEFLEMSTAVRTAEASLGRLHYGCVDSEESIRSFRRSLYVVRDMNEGDVFTSENIRSIRPSNGLSPKHLPGILGRQASRSLTAGTPLEWGFVAS